MAAIKDIYNAEGVDHARIAIKAFEVDDDAKHPKAVATAPLRTKVTKGPGSGPVVSASLIYEFVGVVLTDEYILHLVI